MARPSSASNASRLATRTTLIPDAAICRANSLPIPDEAPVTSAHGPNCPLSSAAFIVLFLSVDCNCCSIVWSLPLFRLDLGSAAVNKQFDTGDETGVIRRQKQRRLGNF